MVDRQRQKDAPVAAEAFLEKRRGKVAGRMDE